MPLHIKRTRAHAIVISTFPTGSLLLMGALIRPGGRVAGDILEVIAQSAGDLRK